MKSFDLSQYMLTLTQAAGAGKVGYSSAQTYAAGTVGAAIKANNFTTVNTIPKGSATGLVASAIVDDGATVALSRSMTVVGDVSATGSGNFGAAINTGSGVGDTFASSVEIGQYRTGNGAAHLDFHARVGSDYDARLHRGTGINGAFDIMQEGTGPLTLNSAASPISFVTGGVGRATVDLNGRLNLATPAMSGLLNIYQPNGSQAIGLRGDGHGLRMWDDTAGYRIESVDTGLNAAYHPLILGGNHTILQTGGGDRFTCSADGNNYSSSKLFAPDLNIAGTIDTQVLRTGGSGQNGLTRGNGDSAGYSVNNMYLDLWYGMGIRSFDGSIKGYIDSRNGILDMWGGFRQNGTPMQTALGFTPVRQGGGAFQLTNTVYIGWATNHLRAQVDTSDLGRIVTDAAGFPFSAGGEIKSAGSSAMLQFDMRDNLGIQNGWYGTGGFARYWRSDIGDRYQIHSTAFRHVADVGADCGGPGFRWATVWCQSSTMATSDAREKDWRGGLNEAELAASKELAKEIGIYRWLRDIEAEGDAAKLQCGLIAQKIMEVFERHGLDALGYGFVQHSTWEESTHNGPLNEDGTIDEIITPGGDRYAVMYPDLCMFMMAGQEQRLAALEALL